MTLDLPRIGLGTFSLSDPQVCRDTTKHALEIGYRHLDTAQMYGNEEHVGAGLRESPVDREDVVIATKLHPRNLAYDDAIRTAHDSRDRLGIDTIDLLYVHWPVGAYDPHTTLAALDDLRDDGVIRHIGVSNFTIDLLDEARRTLDAPIAAHQIECHPFLQQADLRAYAHTHNHTVVAYCPLARARLTDPVLEDIADKHGVSVPVVCLAWCLAQDSVVPIPKATGDHVQENWDAQDLRLDNADLERIDAIDHTHRLVDRPDAAWNP